jgi:hypothetical protein
MTDTDNLQQDGKADAALQTAPRFLLYTVYIMGVVLVLLLIALIAGIIWKARSRGVEVKAEVPSVDVGLPAGAEVSGMQLDGDRLAIHAGDEIIIVDLRRNAVVSRVKLARP